MRSRINRSKLYSRVSPELSGRDHGLNRRNFLRAGIAAAAIGSRQDTAAGYSVTTGEDWLSLRSNGEEVFRLDVAHFHGKPRLWQWTRNQNLAFGLSDARFPGTDLSADLACEMWGGSFGTHVALTIESLGLSFRGYAEEWLTDRGLISRVSSPGDVIAHRELSVKVKSGSVSFNRHGHLEFSGRSCATIHLKGQELPCDSLSLRPGANTSSALSNGARKRTHLTATRGDSTWPLDAPSGEWAYHSRDDRSLFDSIEIEAHESSLRTRSYAVVATRSAERPALELRLNEALTGSNGKNAKFYLEKPVYAESLSGEGDSIFVAALARPVSLHLGTLKLALRNPSSFPAVRVTNNSNALVAEFQAEGSFEGRIGEAIVTPAHRTDSWPMQIGPAIASAPASKPKAAKGRVTVHQGRTTVAGPPRFRVLRPSDLLDLTFSLDNVKLRVEPTNAIVAHKDDSSKDSLMVVQLPPQTFSEETQNSSTQPDSDICNGVSFPARAYLPRESRIGFKLFTKGEDSALLDLDMLLGWENYPVNVCGRALKTPTDEAPGPLHTAIYMPAGLAFSPDETGTFSTSKPHHSGLFGSDTDDTYSIHNGDVYRVWNGRLTGDLQIRPVEYLKANAQDVMFGLADSDRQSIVDELKTSDLPVQHLVVSTGGGWVKGHTRLLPDLHCGTPLAILDSLSLNIADGVEQLEEVTYPVFLIPTGHRASLVKTTVRQWCCDSNGLLEGALITRYKIAFHEKTRVFDLTTYWTAGKGYPFPFKRVTIPIKETPTLFAGDKNSGADGFSQECMDCTDDSTTVPYWAWVGTDKNHLTPFSFPVICTDRDNVTHTTSMAMVIAAGVRAFDCPKYIGHLLIAYNMGTTAATSPMPSPTFAGENVAYAASRKPGDAAFPTSLMMLEAAGAMPQDASLVPWRPQMATCQLSLSATAAFTTTGSAPLQVFQYNDFYLDHPFDNPAANYPSGNSAEIILSTAQPGDLNFYAKLGGGLIQPSTQVAGLSRAFGNIFSAAGKDVQAIQDVANDAFRVADAFADAAQLLGAFELADIINDVTSAVENAAAVPKLIAQQLNELPAGQSLTSMVSTINTLLGIVNGFNLSTAFDALLASAVPPVAFIRAFVFEQISTTPYINGKSDSTYLAFSNLPNLGTELAESLEYRLQHPIMLCDPTTCIMTLNQLRDYVLAAGLSAGDTASAEWQKLSAFPGNFSADTNTLTTSLNNFQTAVQAVIAQVSAPYTAAQLALTALQSSLAGNPPDVLGIVSSLQQLATQVQNVADPVSGLIRDTNSTLQNLVTAITSVNSAVGQVYNDFSNLIQEVAAQDAKLTASANAVLATLTQIQAAAQYQINPAMAAATTLADSLMGLSTFYATTFKQPATTAATAISTFVNALQGAQQVRASYDYDTPLKSSGMFIASKAGTVSELALHTSMVVNLLGTNGNGPSADLTISATISNFTLLLIPEFQFLSVGFNSAQFTSTNGSAPQVNCALDDKSVQFIGPLNFVFQLAEQIKLSTGIAVQQTDSGVSLSYDFSLPSIEAGAFTLSNVALHSGVALDFGGGPIQVNFGFADPNQHFLMTYTIFGGGGYLDFSFSPLRGISAFDINGALEFGAEAALDFGVASGDLYIFGGFLFNMTGDELDLGGYVRAGGDLNVLDLITASVEFSLSLTYEDRSGTAWLVGECDITVEVDILFVIDVSVDIRLHEEFYNGGSS
jgi:hypothetical protein